MEISVNDDSLAMLGTSNYVYLPVEPGEHVIDAEMGGITPPIPARHKITAAAGEVYFLQASVGIATAGSNRIELQALPSDSGKLIVREKATLVDWVYLERTSERP